MYSWHTHQADCTKCDLNTALYFLLVKIVYPSLSLIMGKWPMSSSGMASGHGVKWLIEVCTPIQSSVLEICSLTILFSLPLSFLFFLIKSLYHSILKFLHIPDLHLLSVDCPIFQHFLVPLQLCTPGPSWAPWPALRHVLAHSAEPGYFRAAGTILHACLEPGDHWNICSDWNGTW